MNSKQYLKVFVFLCTFFTAAIWIEMDHEMITNGTDDTYHKILYYIVVFINCS